MLKANGTCTQNITKSWNVTQETPQRSFKQQSKIHDWIDHTLLTNGQPTSFALCKNNRGGKKKKKNPSTIESATLFGQQRPQPKNNTLLDSKTTNKKPLTIIKSAH